MIKKITITMKSLFSSKRSKAILGIGLIAIGIGAISKKVISYPTGGCMKDNQELTLNKEIVYPFIKSQFLSPFHTASSWIADNLF